jgi:putative transposase
MPRRTRIHLPNMPLHIVQRGHNRDACFFEEADYHTYRHWLGVALKETDCRLHAYVLMTNHVHLLLTPKSGESVSRCIMALGRRYVQYVNKTYGRTGTLWDSRYKSSLIQADAYLLACYRYIEMNPVRAGMVDEPAHYRWSSYRSNALGQDDELVTSHDLYNALGPDETARQKHYRALFKTQLDKEPLADIRMAIQQSQPLGDSRFSATIERMTGQKRALKPRGRPRKIVEVGHKPA